MAYAVPDGEDAFTAYPFTILPLRARIYPLALSTPQLIQAVMTNDPRGRALFQLLRSRIARSHNFMILQDGTDALHLALTALGVTTGDEVVVPSYNCLSVAAAILAVGAKPVFCDIEAETLGPSVRSIRQAVSPQTRAVVLTHQFGLRSRDSLRIWEFCQASGYYLIDDSAQLFGDSLAATLGHVGVLSFGRSKPLPCGGGGVFTWRRDVNLREGLEILPPAARLAEGSEVISSAFKTWKQRHLPARYVNLIPQRATGFHNVIERLEATSLGLNTPRRISSVRGNIMKNAIRQQCAYQQECARARRTLTDELQKIHINVIPGTSASSDAYLPILLPPAARTQAIQRLASLGYQSSWYHYPLHLQSRLRCFRQTDQDVTDDLWRRVLLLPHRDLTPATQKGIVGVLRDLPEDGAQREVPHN